MTDDKLAEEALIEAAAQAIDNIEGGMGYAYEDFCRDAARAAFAVFAENDAQARLAGERAGKWQDIASAPKDGTRILAWCVHPYASSMTQPEEYVGPVIAQWIEHNNGGWTWHGHLGNFTHWQPLPEPPAIRKEAASITQAPTPEPSNG